WWQHCLPDVEGLEQRGVCAWIVWPAWTRPSPASPGRNSLPQPARNIGPDCPLQHAENAAQQFGGLCDPMVRLAAEHLFPASMNDITSVPDAVASRSVSTSPGR